MAGVDCQCQPFQQTLKKCFKYPVGKGQRNTTLAKAKAENVLSIKAMSGPHWQYIGWYIVLQRHLCYALNFHKAGRKYCTYSGKVSYTIFSDIRCRRWEEESQHTTGPVDRMLHRIINRKRRETKQQPSRAWLGHQISCCLLSPISCETSWRRSRYIVGYLSSFLTCHFLAAHRHRRLDIIENPDFDTPFVAVAAGFTGNETTNKRIGTLQLQVGSLM